MKTPTDEVERLNRAAGALFTEEFISSFRWQSAVLFAIPLMAPKHFGGLTFPLLLFGTVLAMAAMWTRWRLKLYIPSGWCFTLAVGSLNAFGGTSYIGVTDALLPFLFVMMGGGLFYLAGIFATVNAPGWEEERSLVRNWWQVLMTNPKGENVIEFRAENNWLGYHIRRLIRCEHFWVDLALRKGWRRLRPLGYSVRKLNEI